MSEPAVADRRVHPGTIALRFAKEAPSTVLALPAALVFISDRGLSQILWIAGFIAIAVIAGNVISWLRFKYGVGEREVVIESGILSRNRRSIPFDRIQDIDIERALLARLFGLAKVRIETGAGGKDEGVLDSVTMAEAARLREIVRAWRSGGAVAADPAAPAAPAPVPEARLLFDMHPPRLLLFGLFNFSLVYIAGLFAFLQTFDDPLKSFFGFDIYDPGRWVGLSGNDLQSRFTPAAIAAVLFLAILLGIVAGIARTLARDWGYRLTLEGSRFRRERGLFTRSEAVIGRRRVQLGQVQTGPVREAFGWYGLSFQTLGAGTAASGHQSAAPFARLDELPPILAETGTLRLPPPPELVQVSSRHVLRSVAVSILPALLAILVVSFYAGQAIFLVFLLPLLGVHAALDRRFHRYALGENLLFVQRGIWRRRLWLVPLANIQSIGLSRSWLQRRLGLSTLAVDTAGAPLLNLPRIVDVRAATALALAERLSAYSSGRKSGTDR